MGRFWNFTRIEYWNFEYKLNIKSNIQWLRIDLQCWTLSRCLAGMQRHLMAMDTSQSHRHRGHTCWSFCLLSDLTMKINPHNCQTSHISYVHIHTRLQNKIIYILFLLTVTITNPNLTLTNHKLTLNANLKPTLLTNDPSTQYRYYSTTVIRAIHNHCRQWWHRIAGKFVLWSLFVSVMLVILFCNLMCVMYLCIYILDMWGVVR